MTLKIRNVKDENQTSLGNKPLLAPLSSSFAQEPAPAAKPVPVAQPAAKPAPAQPAAKPLL